MDGFEHIPFDLVRKKAKDYGLPFEFIAAIIKTESGGNPYAMRFEAVANSGERALFTSSWKYFWSPAEFAEIVGSSYATEMMGQSTSWGPMQVMGTVAREYGFKGWFAELCDWDRGLEYGCQHLRSKYAKYGSLTDAAAAYNAGTVRKTNGGLYVNEKYVDEVMDHYRTLRE